MNGLELIQRATARWRSGEGAGTSTYLLCQRFDGWYVSRAYGYGANELRAYPTAYHAYLASPIYKTSGVNDPDIKPGDSLYFRYGAPGHIVTAVGRDLRNGRLLVSQTANAGTVVRRLSNNVKIIYADTIGFTYLGASHRNGSNGPRAGVTPWNIGTPTGGGAELPDIPITDLEVSMGVYARAANDANVYELANGKKYHINKAGWKAITNAYRAAGAKVPYSRAYLSKSEMNSIPNG